MGLELPPTLICENKNDSRKEDKHLGKTFQIYINFFSVIKLKCLIVNFFISRSHFLSLLAFHKLTMLEEK